MSEPSGLSDEQLVAAVRRAVRNRLGPDEVEQQVGQRAWINTRRGVERVTLNLANISADESSEQTHLPPLAKARDVVYWGRPVAANNPLIVGILWHKDGSPEIFFGIVYPP